MEKVIKIVMIGAGTRSIDYITHAKKECSEKYCVVGVADPDRTRIDYVKRIYDVPDENCFSDWRKLLNRSKFGDVAIIGTQDNMHFEPAIKAMEIGYDLLLEKPMAQTPEECYLIAKIAEKLGRKVLVCHVLRYTPFFMTIKQLINQDKIGKIIHINHTEAVGIPLYTHAFVRGPWKNSKESTPLILAKCSHDVDILQWLIGEPYQRVQSFGNLNYFKKENAPKDAPKKCIDGCRYEKECPFSAIREYQENDNPVWRKWATHRDDPTKEDIQTLFRKTEYGNCIFQCGNDLVDHQTVNFEYASGATASFTVCAFSRSGRRIEIMGTKGEIFAEMSGETIHVYDHLTGETTEYPVSNFVRDQHITGGHGGGDIGIVVALYDYLNNSYTGNSVGDVQISMENHIAAFAAEEARLSGTSIEMSEFTKKICESAKQKYADYRSFC